VNVQDILNQYQTLESIDELATAAGITDVQPILDDFGDVCDDELYGLVDMICEWNCCLAPGATPGNGDDDDEEECIEPTAEAGENQELQVCSETDAEVSFVGSGSGTAPLSYSWDFGDGSTSTEQNPTHTYSYPFDASPYTPIH